MDKHKIQERPNSVLWNMRKLLLSSFLNWTPPFREKTKMKDSEETSAFEIGPADLMPPAAHRAIESMGEGLMGTIENSEIFDELMHKLIYPNEPYAPPDFRGTFDAVEKLTFSVFEDQLGVRTLTQQEVNDYKKYIEGLIMQNEVDSELANLFFDLIINQGIEHKKIQSIFQFIADGKQPIFCAQRDVFRFQREVRSRYGREGEDSGEYIQLIENNLIFRQDKKGGFWFYKRGERKRGKTEYRLHFNLCVSDNMFTFLEALCSAIASDPFASIHFKIFPSNLGGMDPLTIYFSHEDVKEIGRILDEVFQIEGIKDHLVDDTLPTGLAMARGVTLAAEPLIIHLTRIKNLSGEKRSLSNNQLHAFMLVLAYVFAMKKEEELRPHQVSKELDPLFKKYYTQVLKLAGVNPENLMPIHLNGGKVPQELEEVRVKLAG